MVSIWRQKMNMMQKQIHKDSIVLDAGCGKGYNTSFFSSYAKKIYAIDLIKNNIQYAKQKYPNDNVYFTIGDVDNTCYIDNCFDVVYSCWVMEHLKNPQRFIDEIYRILKTGGILIIWTPNIKCFSGLTSKILPSRIERLLVNSFTKGGNPYPTYMRGNSIRKLDKLCKNKFKRISMVRFDSDEYVSNNKILHMLWKLKHRIISNSLLRWMYGSFYVKYEKQELYFENKYLNELHL
jgi:ubiquinone/menaquinone biosynthesis C-methylase UbiE